MQNVLRCLLLAALVCLELRRRLFRFFFRRKEQGTTVSCQKQAVQYIGGWTGGGGSHLSFRLSGGRWCTTLYWTTQVYEARSQHVVVQLICTCIVNGKRGDSD